MHNVTGSNTSVAKTVRVAAVLYLVLFALGPFVFLYGKAAALVPGDAAATAANVLRMGTQFRLGMVIESVIFFVEIVLAAILYEVFRPVSPILSLAASFARLGEAVMQGVNLLTSILVLFVLGGAGYMSVFATEELNALGLLFLSANHFVVLVWGLFFGFHLALLSYLVYRSDFLPRALGVLLAFSAIGYLLQSYGSIVSPGASRVLDVLVVVLAVPGELAFTLWLLLKSIDSGKWQERAAARQQSLRM